MARTEDSIHRLVRREVVVHFNDGETTMRGFLIDVFSHPDAVLIAKARLLLPGSSPDELDGDALVYENQIKFLQVLGG